jgi:hypothetical protein
MYIDNYFNHSSHYTIPSQPSAAVLILTHQNHLPSDMATQPRTETQNGKQWHMGQRAYQIISVLHLYKITILASTDVYTTLLFTTGNLD